VFSKGGFIEETPVSGVDKKNLRRDFRDLPIIFAFFSWWLFAVPSTIINSSISTVKKLFAFFSVDLLARTLIEPWKRDEIDTTNMALDGKIRVLIMNLISRLVGFVVRAATISIGLGAIAATAVAGIILALGAILLPAIAVCLIILSIY